MVAGGGAPGQCLIEDDQVVDDQFGQGDQAEAGFQVEADMLAVGLEGRGRQVVAALDPLAQPPTVSAARPGSL